ncbi:hypothetical protein ACTPEM_26195, partial [Clostridioides difficile]
IDIDTKFNESLKGISRMESLDRILEFGNKKYSFSEEEKVRMAGISIIDKDKNIILDQYGFKSKEKANYEDVNNALKDIKTKNLT